VRFSRRTKNVLGCFEPVSRFLALPNNEGFPPQSLEHFFVRLIPSFVPGKLFAPIFCAGSGYFSASTIVVKMPKASMYKDSCAPTGEGYVWPSRQPTVVFSKPITECMQNTAHGTFRSSFGRPNATHDMTCCWIDVIKQPRVARDRFSPCISHQTYFCDASRALR
jgi:hypothetical protein